MGLILLALIFVLFTKEFIIFNDETIIHTTFISLLLAFINIFSSYLEDIFDKSRVHYKTSLNTTSLNEQKQDNLNMHKENFTSHPSSIIQLDPILSSYDNAESEIIIFFIS